MRQVAFVAGTQARRRWRALLLVVVLVGVVGGLSLSLIAGARRSSTVVDRYLSTSRPYDVEVFAPTLTLEQLRAMPGVTRADGNAFVAMSPLGRTGPKAPGINGYAVDFDALDPTYRLLEGSLPGRRDSRGVLVNENFRARYHKSVGDAVEVRMFGLDQGDAVSRGVYQADGPRYRFHITGVLRLPSDVATDVVHSVGAASAGSEAAMPLSRTFYERHRHEFLDFGETYRVRLADGIAGRRLLRAAIEAELPPGADPPILMPAEPDVRRSSLDTPVELETTVLMVLGIGLAAAGLAVTGILLRAEQRGLDGDTPALRTLGFTGRDLGAVAALRNVPVAIASTVLAVLVAIGLSGRYPVGIGRKIELDGGIRVDPLVLGVGALVLVVVLLVAAYLLGLPRSDRRALPSHRRTLARTLAAGGAPTDLTLATQLLFERGRGVRPVPSRVAIAAGAVAVAIMCAVGTYVAGIDHLYSDPGAHGWNWDVAMGNTNFRLSHATRVATRKDDRFTHETIAGYGNAAVDGKGVELLAIAAGGDAPPAIVRGRLPRTASEIALGRAFLDKIGAHIGSIVGLSVVGGEFDGRGKRRTQRMRVVGEALPPIFGEADIGDAGIVTDGGIRAAGGVVTPHYVLADLRAGRSGAAALRRDYTQELVTDTIPARIVNLHGVRGLPELGVGIAGLLGTIVLVSTLGISARARAREVAVLRSLGLPARRLRSVLGWQGLVLGAGMLLVGIPVGLGIGIAFWRRIADGLGVAPDVTIPPLVVVLVPVLLLVAGGASILLARRARRAPVSDLLRVE